MASKLRPTYIKYTFESSTKYFSNKYFCTTCWTEFENIVHFYKHIYQEDKECIDCLKRQTDEILAKKLDIDTIIPFEPIMHKCFAKKKCLICAYVEINQSLTDCYAEFSTNTDLHINDCYVSKYICVECWKIFGSDEKLREHISDDHVNISEYWIGMETEMQLEEHISHNTKAKPFKCKHCDYSTDRKSVLKRHQLTHSDAKPYKCKHCDYSTKSMEYLRMHKFTHSGVKRYKCKRCDYSSTTNRQLKTHELTHTDVKPYKCKECDHSSKTKEQLGRHKLTHTGVKPFKCKQCDYSTNWKKDLHVHELKHSGVKPFKCKQCDYSTTTVSNLRKHEFIHSGEKPFKCKQCEFSSNWKTSLKSHERIHISG